MAAPDNEELDENDDNNDWCWKDNRVTRWDDETCTTCGREWGMG